MFLPSLYSTTTILIDCCYWHWSSDVWQRFFSHLTQNKSLNIHHFRSMVIENHNKTTRWSTWHIFNIDTVYFNTLVAQPPRSCTHHDNDTTNDNKQLFNMISDNNQHSQTMRNVLTVISRIENESITLRFTLRFCPSVDYSDARNNKRN